MRELERRTHRLHPDRNRNKMIEPRWSNMKLRVRSHIFRLWTALAILGGYVYGWLYVPEALTWWKRTIASAIEAACSLLPYPWGDRIEATLGNFGLWVQITIAIIVFRILVWLVMSGLWLAWRSRGGV
jgi:hypothetical protein